MEAPRGFVRYPRAYPVGIYFSPWAARYFLSTASNLGQQSQPGQRNVSPILGIGFQFLGYLQFSTNLECPTLSAFTGQGRLLLCSRNYR